MATIIRFTKLDTGAQTNLNDGLFVTSSVNGVESTPDNIVDSLRLTRHAGEKKIGDQDDKRPMTLEGILNGGDPTTLRSQLLAFKRDVAGDGYIDIQFEGDSIMRFYVTVQGISVANAAHQLDHVPYIVRMVAMDPPYGEDIEDVSLLDVAGINTNILREDDLGGSADPSMKVQIKIPTVGNLTGIEFRNDETNTGLLMQRSFETNDTVVIDTGKSDCRINGLPVDFSGQVPRFIPRSNNWHINFLTSNVTIDVSQGLYTTERLAFGTSKLAQSFQPTGNVSTQRIDVMLARLGNPSNVKLTIFTDSAGAPDTALDGGTSTVSGSTIPETPGYISFSLQNVVALATSTTYWIVIEVTGAINDVENGVYWKVSSLAPYASGQLSKTTDGGSSWSAISSADAVFRVWKTTVLASNTNTAQETYSENFSTTTNRDGVNTTANWDTVSGTVTLGV